MTMEESGLLTSAQRRLIAIGWLTYCSFYLGRLNISPTLSSIAEDLNVSLAHVGFLGTAFFVSYAIGQVIMGQLGNRISPRLLIFIGLMVIGFSNILFSQQSAFEMMVVLWSVNGIAQAMGWGPMLRILSSNLNVEQIKRVSVGFSISFQIGTAVAWGLAGLLILYGSWENAFLVPGVLLLAVGIMWYLSDIDIKNQDVQMAKFDVFDGLMDGLRDVKRLLPVLLVTACIGAIYIGILIWLPTLMEEWQFIPDGMAELTTAIVPLFGIPGMILAGWILTWFGDIKRTLLAVLSCLLLSLLLSYFTTSILQGLSMLVIVAIVSGMAGLLLSSAPMLLVDSTRVSSAGGLLTAVWSVSGGVSSTVSGGIAENAGWSGVYLLWVGFTAVAIVLSLAIPSTFQSL